MGKIKPQIDLELSIKALRVYGIEPAIINNMLENLHKINNKRMLFRAYLQGKRDQIYWATKWEELAPIGKYRVIKQFLKWYSNVSRADY